MIGLVILAVVSVLVAFVVAAYYLEKTPDVLAVALLWPVLCAGWLLVMFVRGVPTVWRLMFRDPF